MRGNKVYRGRGAAGPAGAKQMPAGQGSFSARKGAPADEVARLREILYYLPEEEKKQLKKIMGYLAEDYGDRLVNLRRLVIARKMARRMYAKVSTPLGTSILGSIIQYTIEKEEEVVA